MTGEDELMEIERVAPAQAEQAQASDPCDSSTGELFDHDRTRRVERERQEFPSRQPKSGDRVRNGFTGTMSDQRGGIAVYHRLGDEKADAGSSSGASSTMSKSRRSPASSLDRHAAP